MRIAFAPLAWHQMNRPVTNRCECEKGLSPLPECATETIWESTNENTGRHVLERRQRQCPGASPVAYERRIRSRGVLTSVSEQYHRISHHGVREVLLERQAEAIGIPLEKVYLLSGKSEPCTNEFYEQIMGGVMAKFCARGLLLLCYKVDTSCLIELAGEIVG